MRAIGNNFIMCCANLLLISVKPIWRLSDFKDKNTITSSTDGWRTQNVEIRKFDEIYNLSTIFFKSLFFIQ